MTTIHGEKTGSPSRDKKDVPLNIRVASTEKAAFDMAAEIAGVPLSAWIRERLRRIARKELEEAGRLIPFLQEQS